MIVELLLFGSLAFILLIPLIGDNPNDVLGEVPDGVRRQPPGASTKRQVFVRDDLPTRRKQIPVGSAIQCDEPACSHAHRSDHATARPIIRKRCRSSGGAIP